MCHKRHKKGVIKVYINPVLVGVIGTILTEIVIIAIAIVVANKKGKK